MAALGGREVAEELELWLGQGRKALHRLADEADAAAVRARLEKVVGHGSVTGLLPVAFLEVGGRQEGGLTG